MNEPSFAFLWNTRLLATVSSVILGAPGDNVERLGALAIMRSSTAALHDRRCDMSTGANRAAELPFGFQAARKLVVDPGSSIDFLIRAA